MRLICWRAPFRYHGAYVPGGETVYNLADAADYRYGGRFSFIKAGQ